MRDRFHENLEQVVQQVSALALSVEHAVRQATRALLDASREYAEEVISGDMEIDLLCRRIESDVIELQLRQQPVARDLRLLLATQRIVADLERSGDLAKNIAKQVRRRYPEHLVPDSMRGTVADLGEAAASLLHKAGIVFTDQDASSAREVQFDDDRIDSLHRILLREIIDSTGRVTTEATVDLTLIGRFYERFADHAVAISRQVVYLSTGELV